ncbi:MAG: T9SS type A sorting domain-containing protein [Bacteroidia bacterium]|nr:T9SS type A sorting domain-containing protein [Bacteroidia bacterium]
MIKKLFILLLFIPFTSISQPINLEVRAFAQGFYLPASSRMVAVADPVNFPNLCDTATIVLIDSASGQGLFCSPAAFSVNGYGSIILPSTFFGGSYLTGVRFRNTLHILTKNTFLIDSTSISIDLTTPANVCCVFDSTLGVATAYSGDVNRDGTIDGSDLTVIGNDIAGSLTGYVISDLNGDAIVNQLDMDLADANSQLFLFDDYNGLCLPTSVDDIGLNTFSAELYPNPFRERFTIKFEESIQDLHIQISDVSGKICYSKSFLPATEITIENLNLKAGFYFIEITTEKKHKFIKVIAQ